MTTDDRKQDLIEALEARDRWKAEARTLRGERNMFEDELAAELDKLTRIREMVSDPCTPGCCDHCDGKNEGWEMVLAILDGPPAQPESRKEPTDDHR